MWLGNLNLSRMIVHFLQRSFRYIQRGLFLTKLQLFGRVNAYSPLCWQQGPSSREAELQTHIQDNCSSDCCTELPHLGFCTMH